MLYPFFFFKLTNSWSFTPENFTPEPAVVQQVAPVHDA
jgi:hypothetical protein